MQTTTNLKPLFGELLPKTLNEFRDLVEAEVQVHHNALVEEFKERKDSLLQSAERKINEFEFMSNIIAANTAEQEGRTNPVALIRVEAQIASLNFDTVAASYTLEYWRRQYGENMIVPVMCDLMNYFIKQFRVKENLSETQIVLIVSKLLAAHPKLRIMELIFVLNNALNGDYGPTYQRIGIDTVLGWLGKFFEASALHLEAKMTNAKPDESRGELPWEIIERRTRQYQAEIKLKAEMNSKAFAAEKRKREIEEEIERLKIEAE